jgi:hypothetical protein
MSGNDTGKPGSIPDEEGAGDDPEASAGASSGSGTTSSVPHFGQVINAPILDRGAPSNEWH